MVDINRQDELDRALELLHFAFRAVIAKPDRLLAARGLSRVHHRILYFIRKNPGISVGQLLAILGISKQALNVPLRTLEQKAFISFDKAEHDARIKQLSLTTKGAAFEDVISGDQRERFRAVFKRIGPPKESAWREAMEYLARKDY